MKIVINSCFGGFSLSPLATLELAKRKGRECYFFTHPRDTSDGSLLMGELRRATVKQAAAAFVWYAYDIPDISFLPSQSNFSSKPMDERKAINEAWQKHSISERDIERNDPDLVAVVEALGDAANGTHAQLKIVEIPDGVEWQVEEYDGNEHIAERHETWA